MMDSEILLKIYRQYDKDDAVSVYKKKISDLNLQIGILKSDLAEKNDEIQELKKNINEIIRDKVSKKMTKHMSYIRILESQILNLKKNGNT